ncbi:MAG: RimK family alpha-L-glutamate ligase [Nitrospiraceae bacterium]|nr:RimK family alpha-L-glutamate ligase [Nitrospiraceae bacterium]
MRIAMMSLGSKSSKMTIEALKQYFDEVIDLDLKKIDVEFTGDQWQVFYEGKELGDFDCVYPKGSFRYETLLRAISNAYFGRAYNPFAPNAFTIGHDKILTQLELQKKNIPMPKTYIITSSSAAKDLLNRISYPIVIKIPNGTQGKGVMFAESHSTAISLLDTLTALRHPFLIQNYIDTNGTDLRAFVIGNEVVASMMRKSEAGDNRSNLHSGGKAVSIELDEYTKKIAIESAKACNTEICAVDILNGAKGPVVIEINLSPGLQGITQATNINVADHIARFLYNKTSEFLKNREKEKVRNIMEDLNIQNENNTKTESESMISTKTIISELDFRGNRILLPEFVTKISKFKPSDEYNIEVKKEFVKISRI